MEIKEKHISYAEIKEGVNVENDDYGLAAYLTETRKRAFFANPNLTDYSQILLNLELIDGVVSGRSMSFPTKLKIGDQFVEALSGSTLDVPEKLRHLGIGADMMLFYVKGTDYEYNLASGISEIALPLYKVLKFKILEFPRMMSLRDARCIIESKGIKGVGLKIMSALVNIPVKLFNGYFIVKSRGLQKRFDVRKLDVVPEWVDKMVLEDGHKYMEAHDHKWFQWNLDYNFKGDKEDIQSFYAVYQKNRPVGFFMTKERYRKEAGGKLKNFVLGTIVEWGKDKDCNSLSESMLYKLALSTFSSKTDIIEIATDDNVTISEMKKWGFIKHGFAHIAFKDRKKMCNDAKDIKNWRIRYGYADVILT